MDSRVKKKLKKRELINISYHLLDTNDWKRSYMRMLLSSIQLGELECRHKIRPGIPPYIKLPKSLTRGMKKLTYQSQ